MSSSDPDAANDSSRSFINVRMAPAPAPAPPPAPPPTPQNGGGAVDLLTLLLGVLIALARIDYRNRGSDGQLL